MCKTSHSVRRVTFADLIFVLAVILIIWSCFTFRFVRINGDSMYPYFHDGQIVVINTRFHMEDLQNDDIIVFETGAGYSVKRIIASAGAHVVLTNGEIHINSMRILPYIYDGDSTVEYDLGKGQFFVIGDNYSVSCDSRDYGPVDSDDIVGKVVMKFQG